MNPLTLKQLTTAYGLFYRAFDRMMHARWKLDNRLRNDSNREELNEILNHLWEAKELMREVVEPKLGELYRESIEK